MREKNSFIFIKLFIFLLHLFLHQSIEIQIQLPQARKMNFGRFDPFEDFLTLNNDIEQLANALMHSSLDDTEEATELVKNDSDNSNKSHHVHREVKRSQVNGFQTIEITEVHVGHRPNTNAFNGMPMSGIIISKPKNLKGLASNNQSSDDFAMPFHVLTQLDDFFESMLGEMALRMIAEDLDLEDYNEEADISTDVDSESKNNKDGHYYKNNNHNGHIKIIDIKDITEEEKSKNKLKETKVEAKDAKIDAGGKKLDDVKIEDVEKPKQNIDLEIHDDQVVAIKFDTEAQQKSSDNIMTAKERKKQILEERKKSLFTKICKYVFYSLVLFAIYVLVRKLLQIIGVIEQNNTKLPCENSENTILENKNIELKNSNSKSE